MISIRRYEIIACFMLHEIDHLDGRLFPERIDETKLMVPSVSMETQNTEPLA
ncbi:peptide deformylase [Endozoicomonas sp. SESOKO1]|uniref:peptide deformylase n=1 Tax=Endozoicomonas sp. SESOKO1 TaxID=2828742 RepID=UPI00359FCDD5